MNAPFIITTSWDDGHPNDLRLAELLHKYDLPGTFYIPFETGRDVVTPRQIRDLSSRFEIGAHTMHHRPLTNLPPRQAQEEIRESRRWIQDITGVGCRSFCFPLGKFRSEHIGMVSEAGFSTARTVQLLSIERPRLTDGILLMPTTVQAFSHSKLALVRNLTRRMSVADAISWARYSRRSEWLSIARTYLRRTAHNGGVFHLWGHSWEIEEHQQWSRLEHAFRMLSELRGSAQFRTNGEVSASPVVHAVSTAHVATENPHRS